MGSLTPVQIALLIIAGVAVAGVIINVVRRGQTLSGYDDVAPDIIRLAGVLGGETFRDGSDVVISGAHNGVPTVVRFSTSENTPGLHIRMPAPATFQLSVAHVSASSPEGGRKLIKTGNANLDARFATRTDHYEIARMFLQISTSAGLLESLVCSRNTFLSVGNGAIELSELLVPTPNTSDHILEHVRTLGELAKSLQAMPGADRVKVATMEREHHLAGRIAMAIGMVVALACIITATRTPSTAPALTDVNASVANGILPADAVLLRDSQSWRVASAEDFDPVAGAWARGQGQTLQGRIEADFSGDSTSNDVAYFLIGPSGRRRIVLLANHKNSVDGEMADIGLIARVPKTAVPRIEWQGGKAPEEILGDGLLVVQRHGETQSSVIFFLSKSGVVSGAPANYQQISLQ